MECPKCHEHQGFIQKIGLFNYFSCPACGYNITAKHYAAKLRESQGWRSAGSLELSGRRYPIMFKI